MTRGDLNPMTSKYSWMSCNSSSQFIFEEIQLAIRRYASTLRRKECTTRISHFTDMSLSRKESKSYLMSRGAYWSELRTSGLVTTILQCWIIGSMRAQERNG